jgi:ABC-type glycerol-3-phosphate transport system substrate-binding protein
MPKHWTRRALLKGSAATALAMPLAAPFISHSLAASGKVVVGMEAGSPYEAFYKAHHAEFTASSGVEVELLSIPHDSIRQQFVLDALSGAGGYDVYIADQVWLPEFHEKGFVADLTSHVSEEDRADFSTTALETVTYRGAVVALPIMVHNCALYYRTDLFEKAGLSGPPANWDEYRDFARKTTDTSAGVWGTLVASKQGIEAATRLHSFYQQAGGDLLDANGVPTINSDAGRAALELMSALVFEDKAAPEGVLELPDMQGLWLEGKLAMAPVWPYLYSLSKEPLGGKFALATAPGLVRPAGTVYSWGFAQASGAKNPEGALEFIRWATSTDLLYTFGKEWLNPVPRNSSIEKIRADAGISDEDKAAIAAFAESAAAGKSMTMVPQYSQLLDILGVMQSGVMSKAMTIDQALTDGQARAEAAMASQG